MSFYKLRSDNKKNYIYSPAIASVIAITLSAPLKAAEDDLFFEMPVVLSASRLEQPISETPMAVTSIDRQIIEASGARTIPEVLRLVPGIVVGNSVNEWGEESRLVVTYHGHTDQYSKQMQVLIDGRSIYEPLLGGVNWNMLPINVEDIERIEVSRGPNSSTYGSNSFLAVINIITRHASEDPGHFTKLRAGNHDIADLLYRYGDNSDDMDYRVTLSTQNDNGLNAKKNIGVFQHSDEEVDNHDDISTGAIDYRIDYQIDNNSTLSYQGGYGKTKLEINESFANLGIKPLRESETTNLHQFFKLEKTLDNKNSYILQYYYNLLDKVDPSISKPFPGYLVDLLGLTPQPVDDFQLFLDFSLKSERHNIEFTHFNQTTDSLRLIWGASMQQDIASSPYWLTDQNTIRRETYQLFGNAEWQINPNNLLNFGASYEDNKSLDGDLSPRISLIHKLNDKHSFRFSVSRAIRSPFISEEFGNTVFKHDLTSGGAPTGVTLIDQQLVPNDEINNETIVSWEIGYFGQLMNDQLLFNVRIFHDKLEGLIHTDNTDVAWDNFFGASAYIHKNLINTEVHGAELELDLNPDSSTRIIGNVSYLEIKNSNNSNLGEEYERSAPEWTTSVMAIKKFNEHYSGSLEYHYVDEMQWLDVPGSDISSSYRTMDARFSRSIRTASSTSELAIIVKNLLNEYNNYHQRAENGPLIEHNLTGYIEYSVLYK
ncbi:MAG: TonB-dependent receptor [Gammaproteobacteria bacterium]|nr:TonB-dependent receptor [Gammaproteobacteria bacterium]